MIEFFREKMKGTFAVVMVVFFCAVFALWGVESLFDRQAKAKGAATVNGEEISEAELANAVSRLRAQYTEMLGGKVDPEFLNDKMLREPALESLISRRLLENYAREHNMVASKALLEKKIVEDKTFSRDGKTFDPAYYKERLAQAGMTPTQYQQLLGRQLVMEQIRGAIGGSAFVTDAEVMDMAKLTAQTRDYDFVRFPLAAAMQTAVAPDEAVEKYYQDHQADFMTEEQVVLEYVEVDKKALAAAVPLDEAAIRDAYDKEAAAFKPVIERKASHILVEVAQDGSHDKTLAEIKQKLAAGEAFDKLARAYSKDEGSATQGGDIGYSNGETFVPEFEKALAALVNVGDVSEPVKTEFGYHIIKLTEKRETKPKSFEERKDALAKELREEEAKKQFSEKVDAVGETTYSAGDLAGPAKELSLAVQKSVPFGRRGGPGVAASQTVIEAAFSPDLLESGKNSEVIEVGDDRAVVIRVAEHNLPKAKDLASVKPVIVEAIKRDMADKQLDEKVAALKQRAEADKSLAGLAADEKLPVTPVKAAKRNAAKDDTLEINDLVFLQPRPTADQVLVQTGKLSNGDRFIVKVNAVHDVDVKPDAPEVAELRKRMLAEAQQREFNTFEKGLRERATIVKQGAADEAVNQ